MSEKLSSAREKETYIVVHEPLSHTKKAVAPNTITYTLLKSDGTTVVNSLQNISVSPTSTINYIVLTGDDLALDVDGKIADRILLIKSYYTETIADRVYTNLPIYTVARFEIDPVEGI